MYNVTYEGTIDAVETTVEVRMCQNTNYQKSAIGLLRASGGKLGKPKHDFKIHLFGGISPLVIFTDTLYSKDYQDILSSSFLPFIREKLPFYDCFFMDNDPK